MFTLQIDRSRSWALEPSGSLATMENGSTRITVGPTTSVISKLAAPTVLRLGLRIGGS